MSWWPFRILHSSWVSYHISEVHRSLSSSKMVPITQSIKKKGRKKMVTDSMKMTLRLIFTMLYLNNHPLTSYTVHFIYTSPLIGPSIPVHCTLHPWLGLPLQYIVHFTHDWTFHSSTLYTSSLIGPSTPLHYTPDWSLHSSTLHPWLGLPLQYTLLLIWAFHFRTLYPGLGLPLQYIVHFIFDWAFHSSTLYTLSLIWVFHSSILYTLPWFCLPLKYTLPLIGPSTPVHCTLHTWFGFPL